MENNIYLITGDDLFERNRKLEDIKKNFGELVKGINYIVLDKDNISTLVSEVTTYPFGFEKKLIIVNVATKATSDDESANTKNDWFNDDITKIH